MGWQGPACRTRAGVKRKKHLPYVDRIRCNVIRVYFFTELRTSCAYYSVVSSGSAERGSELATPRIGWRQTACYRWQPSMAAPTIILGALHGIRKKHDEHLGKLLSLQQQYNSAALSMENAFATEYVISIPRVELNSGCPTKPYSLHLLEGLLDSTRCSLQVSYDYAPPRSGMNPQA